MKVFAMLTASEQREARRFIVEDLADRCRDDPTYRDEWTIFQSLGMVAAHRSVDPLMWENFEYLMDSYDRCSTRLQPPAVRPARNEVVADAPSV